MDSEVLDYLSKLYMVKQYCKEILNAGKWIESSVVRKVSARMASLDSEFASTLLSGNLPAQNRKIAEEEELSFSQKLAKAKAAIAKKDEVIPAPSKNLLKVAANNNKAKVVEEEVESEEVSSDDDAEYANSLLAAAEKEVKVKRSANKSKRS